MSAEQNEVVHCPRCGGAFGCGAANPAGCDCAAIKLSEDQRQEIARRWEGCLCLDCLREMASTRSSAEP